MSSYHITEAHPTPRANRMHSGRGGAGNIHKTTSAALSSRNNSTSSSSSSTISNHHTPALRFSSGRGGAGNIHPSSLATPYSFDDEARRQVSFDAHHDVFHVGRGGAGNWSRTDATTAAAATSTDSGRKLSTESVGSAGSARSGVLARLSGVFERR